MNRFTIQSHNHHFVLLHIKHGSGILFKIPARDDSIKVFGSARIEFKKKKTYTGGHPGKNAKKSNIRVGDLSDCTIKITAATCIGQWVYGPYFCVRS